MALAKESLILFFPMSIKLIFKKIKTPRKSFYLPAFYWFLFYQL